MCAEEHQIKTENPRRLFAISIFCAILGAIIRIFYCIYYPVQSRDAYEYGVIIASWEEMGQLPEGMKIFPLSLWILKIPNHFFNYEIMKGSILVNLIVGLLIIIISIHILGRYFKNDSAVLIAGIVAATHPELVHYSCSGLRENTYLFFSLLAIGYLAKYSSGIRICDLLLSAIFASLAFLCRLEGFEFLIIFNMILFFLFIFKKIHFSKAVCHSILFCFAFGLTVLIICYCFHFSAISSDYILSRFRF